MVIHWGLAPLVWSSLNSLGISVYTTGLGSSISCLQWYRTRIQNWKSWAAGDGHTKPLMCRAEGKRIYFHARPITKQGNTAVFCDRVFFLTSCTKRPNKNKRFCFTSEDSLISSSCIKNERQMSQMKAPLLCVPVLAGNLGFKHCNLKGYNQKPPFWKGKMNQISASNHFSSSVSSVTEMTFWVWHKYILLLL